MPAVRLSPIFNSQVVNSLGEPASGWKIYAYAAGSSAPLATYTDSSGTVAQSNPVVINALGFPTTGQIWLQNGLAYKLVLTDAADVVQKTEDNISGVNDTGSSVSQWQASGVDPTYVSASSFTLLGDQTSEFHVGRRLQFTTTGGTVYGTILTSAYTTLTTVTMAMDGSSVLDAGLSVVNVSILSANPSSLPFLPPKLSAADAGKSLIVNPLGTGFVAMSGSAAYRNKAINGNFQINQLVKSGTVTLAAGEYGHDMWKAGASGCTYTFAKTENVTTITISSGSLVQAIDGTRLQTGTHTLSWQGTAQGKIGAGSYAASGITGAATGGTNINLEFNTGTLLMVQFELGTTPTPFEFVPDDQALIQCQYYYSKSYDRNVAPGTVTLAGAAAIRRSATGESATVLSDPFKTEMRAVPTVTFYNPNTGTSGQIYNQTAAANITVTGVFASLPTSTKKAGAPAHASDGTAGQIIVFHWVADARL